MALTDLQSGDIIYAATTLYNDGGIPGLEEAAVLAVPGTRGVLVNIGHPEEAPEETIYLVRFEDAEMNLGHPVGCLPEEVTDDPTSLPAAKPDA